VKQPPQHRLKPKAQPLDIHDARTSAAAIRRNSHPDDPCIKAVLLPKPWNIPGQEAAVKQFADLTEREILALAISNEEEDSRVYYGFADGLAEAFPASAAVLSGMAEEEVRHRGRLFDLYREKFGDYLPLIRRHDVKGFLKRKPLWLTRPLGLEDVRKYVLGMEKEAARFYRKAAETTRDASTRELLIGLAEEEDRHDSLAEQLTAKHLTEKVKAGESDSERRAFVLQYVQPGLVGLMDGSVSTLAPLFAAAFATHKPFETFLVGLAASVGAGISMGFAEALSDDGTLSGRGSPWIRGGVCGLMTAVGGLGHTLPYLIPDFYAATVLAVAVVVVELGVISWVRHRFMDTPWLQATFQIAVGGALVFLAGILIGSA
jgi:rubrerythrin